MNFNLIVINKSYYVERLTRIILLLSKVAMLFMPVSLLAAYTSCQFRDATFTVRSIRFGRGLFLWRVCLDSELLVL
jgi:hypothetical protein